MKTIKDNNTGSNNTLDILDDIQEVQVSPFFKNKVLNRIEQQKEVKESSLGWFTPQLQFASVALVICINVTTIFYSINNSQNSTEQVSGIESFMQDYQLDTDNSISIN